jgi:hypothetical protein
MPIVERWSIVDTGPGRGKALRGEIQGDERFADGAVVTTSELVALDLATGIARTRHSTYHLGRIDPTFESWLGDDDGSDATRGVMAHRASPAAERPRIFS